MMKKTLLISLQILVLFTACNPGSDKKQMLTGKWQATDLENQKLKEMMDQQNAFLDTFGVNSTDEHNIAVYGFSNIDSAREVLKQEMVEYMAMQDHAVKNTVFDFRADSIVLMDFSGQVDSAKWMIGDDGNLVLEPVGTDDAAEKINMEIMSLSDTLLKLQLTEQGMSSTVIFKPADK